MVAAFGSDVYKIVLVLHILCAIVGFGAVFLNGIYGQQAKARRGREGLAISQANLLVSEVGSYFIYAVFVFGILLVLIGDNVFDFGQTWIWLSMLLYIAALVVSLGMLRPTVRRMQVLMEEMIATGPSQAGPPPQAAEMEVLGKRLGIIGPALDLTMIVILVLMVFKPGGPSL
jgi:uncharacterized membrane protein